MEPTSTRPTHHFAEALVPLSIVSIMFVYMGMFPLFGNSASAAEGVGSCVGKVKQTNGSYKSYGQDVVMAPDKNGVMKITQVTTDTKLKAGECKIIEKDKNGKTTKEWKTTPLGKSPSQGSSKSGSTPAKSATTPAKDTPAKESGTPKTPPKPSPGTAKKTSDPKAKTPQNTQLPIFETPILNTVLNVVFENMYDDADESYTVGETYYAARPLHNYVDEVPQGAVAHDPEGAIYLQHDGFQNSAPVEMTYEQAFHTDDGQPLYGLTPETTFDAPASQHSDFRLYGENEAVIAEEDEWMMEHQEYTVYSDPDLFLNLEDTTHDMQQLPSVHTEFLAEAEANLQTIVTALSDLQKLEQAGECDEWCATKLSIDEQRSKVLAAVSLELRSSSAEIVSDPFQPLPQEKIVPRELPADTKQMLSVHEPIPETRTASVRHYVVLHDSKGARYLCDVNGLCKPTGDFIPVVHRRKNVRSSSSFFSKNEIKSSIVVQQLGNWWETFVKSDKKYKQSASAPCTLLSSLMGGCESW